MRAKTSSQLPWIYVHEIHASFICGRQEEIMHGHAFKLDHCVSLCGSHTINNMSCYKPWRESSARIKTFICIRTVCSLYGHEWQFDFSQGVGWVGGDEDTCCCQTQKSFHMEIYLNSFWQIILERVSFSSSSAHNWHSNDDMTIYGKRLLANCSFFLPAERPLSEFNDKIQHSV